MELSTFWSSSILNGLQINWWMPTTLPCDCISCTPQEHTLSWLPIRTKQYKIPGYEDSDIAEKLTGTGASQGRAPTQLLTCTRHRQIRGNGTII